MPTFSIARLTPDDVARLRAIRLRALIDAPDAFATTHAEASAWPLSRWVEQLATLPTFVAVEADQDVGLVRCGSDADDPRAVWLMSMWVAPDRRRRGVASALVQVVVDDARIGGATRILLEVSDHNLAAVAFYAHAGFEPTGDAGSLPPPRQHIGEHRRALHLRR